MGSPQESFGHFSTQNQPVPSNTYSAAASLHLQKHTSLEPAPSATTKPNQKLINEKKTPKIKGFAYISSAILAIHRSQVHPLHFSQIDDPLCLLLLPRFKVFKPDQMTHCQQTKAVLPFLRANLLLIHIS